MNEGKIILPGGYTSRAPGMEDLEAAVGLLNAWAREIVGYEKFDLADIGREWKTPNFDLNRDTRIVESPDGQIVGYIEVWDLNPPHVTVNLWGRVHPDHSGRGIGSYLLSWAEERARQAISLAPEGARVAVRSFTLNRLPGPQQLFRQAGYQPVRKSLRMVIDFNGAPPPNPELPAGITIRPFRLGKEERQVVKTVRDSFRDHWGFVESPFEDEMNRWKHYMENSSHFEPTLWFVAVEGEEIAGTSLCDLMVMDNPEMGWVGTLGVRREWRNRGLGLALLQHSFVELYRRGKRQVGLGVDAESLTGATQLYLKAGMHSDPDFEFSTYEKELRAGMDLTTKKVE